MPTHDGNFCPVNCVPHSGHMAAGPRINHLAAEGLRLTNFWRRSAERCSGDPSIWTPGPKLVTGSGAPPSLSRIKHCSPKLH